MKRVVNFFLVLSLLLAMVSCQNGNGGSGDESKDYSTGVLVSNEGLFQTGAGSVSHYDEVTGQVINNIFEKENNRVIGNVVQSVARHGDYTVIVANNSNKIEIVNSKTFKSVATIKDVKQPRYYIPVSSTKGYLTSWDGKVYVIDLTTMSVSKTIETGKNGEKGVLTGNYVWVANTGGYVYDNTISVINTTTDVVENTITTEYNPNGIELDGNGNVWVLCGGNSYYDYATNEMVHVSSPKLMCFNAVDYSKLYEYSSFDLKDYVFGLILGKDKKALYLVRNGVIESAQAEYGAMSFKSVYDTKGAIYTVKVNPRTGKLFYSDALDFNSNGKVVIVDPITGTKESSFSVGIIPGGFDF